MKPKLNILAIGAGGVASYLLPALSRSFDLSGTLADGDILEEHNLDRQLFSPKDIGKNKAEALLKHCGLIKTWLPYTKYLDDSDLYADNGGFDLVLCMVDNHPARRIAIGLAEYNEIPLVIAANEYATSQVMYWNPWLPDAAKPINRYPEIGTSDEGSPINCTGIALVSTPQLAIANQVSAALANLMIYLWSEIDMEEPIPNYLPIEFQTTFGDIQTTNVGEIRNV
jgi:hypothetical protein